MGLGDLKTADLKNIWHPFSPLGGREPLMVKRAKGVYLYTADGRKIIDAISSWWVNIHGHAHPKIAKAVGKQAKRLEQVIFAGFTHEPAAQLSKTLMRILPKNQEKIFFSDDGSTSVEVALKFAIQYWHNQGIKRKQLIAIEGSYHGDTFGSMSVGDRGVFSTPFFPYLFEVKFVPFPIGDGQNTIEAMKALVSEDTAAFIFEPLVQGAAGMRMFSADVLDQLVALVQEQGGVCIADEVMTGFGRTGKIFATDYLKNAPDIFCLSKGITGGFLPMGVTSVSKKIAEAFNEDEAAKTFFHGHSYTANPIACAAANASMSLLLKKKTQENITRISQRHQEFVAQFEMPEFVQDVRTTGTILAVELKADDAGYASKIKERIYDFFLAKDLLLRPLGNVIYVIPPYIIADDELIRIYDAIDEFMNELRENN